MKKKKRNKLKNKINELEYGLYGDFAFIAGFTESGFPFGVLKDELEEEDEADIDFDEIPF
ncbi:hypothetical protein SAMN05880501_10310 [Ureibacillus xyleni]|uniref:Uncharacterized protein n=1 Tax=Ureibacillus xyleni TaxID=614648 RepID=A0A285S5D0_9BACL|nr:hypothetical protein [Ureibacillus xyleni]SOC02307.1 hypothetical protein SAMN05880501_10310 [Ureibacillus xyleni]